MTIRTGPFVAHGLAQLALLASASCTVRQPDPANSLSELQPGWNRVAGGPNTGCAQDSSFAFFVHPGSDHRLAIYFQAGGGCWNSQTCDLQGQPTFDPQVDATDDPSRSAGILELSNPRNPIRDYSVVFVPYCTADVFLGARTVTYTTPSSTGTPGRAFQIRHRGSVNAARVLGWVFAHFAEPSLILVTGSSAGAIPTQLYASRVAGHYPRARVVQLGDAAGGFRSPAIPGILAQWGAIGGLRHDEAYRSVDSTAMTFEMLDMVAARTAPRVSFAQFNRAEDATQLEFLQLLGLRGV